MRRGYMQERAAENTQEDDIDTGYHKMDKGTQMFEDGHAYLQTADPERGDHKLSSLFWKVVGGHGFKCADFGKVVS